MMMRHVLLAFAVCANFAADAFSYHGSEECPSPPKVSVITDAVTSDGVLNDASKFWTLWREGAAAAAAEVDFLSDYPNGWWDWGCSDTTGRICCCSEFQTSEIIHT